MPQLDRRQALKLFAAVGAAGAVAPALAACDSESSGSTAGTGKVKIGLVVPQTGASRSLGDEIRNGFNLFLSETGGKLAGRQVDLIIAGEGDSPETAKAAVDRLIQQERVAVVAGISNAAALNAVRDTIESAQVPLVTPSPSTVSVQSTKYIWRTGFVNDEPGRAIASWMADPDNCNKTVYILASSTVGASDDVRAFTEMFNGAVRRLRNSDTAIAGSELTSLDTKDYTPYLTRLRNSGAGAVFCLYSGATAVEFVKALRTAGLPATLQVFGSGLLTEGSLLQQQGDSAKGIYTAMNYATDLDNTYNRRFVSNYQKAYNVIPSTYSVASYDVATVLDKAIAIAGVDAEPKGINTAIARLGQIESPRGAWQFNQNRSPLQKWYLRQVKSDGPMLANVLTSELVTLG